MDDNKRKDRLQPIGASAKRDDRLAAAGTPLGAAVEANKEKKVKGPNRPST